MGTFIKKKEENIGRDGERSVTRPKKTGPSKNNYGLIWYFWTRNKLNHPSDCQTWVTPKYGISAGVVMGFEFRNPNLPIGEKSLPLLMSRCKSPLTPHNIGAPKFRITFTSCLFVKEWVVCEQSLRESKPSSSVLAEPVPLWYHGK